MAENTQAPQGPTLGDAAGRIEGLLSKEDTQTRETPRKPEAKPEQKAEDAEQETPETPEEETPETTEAEPAESTDEETDEAERPKPKGFKVKVAGQEVEVTEDELKSGYSRTADYTRKTTDLAEARKAFEEKEVAAVRAERQQYATRLAEVDNALKELIPSEPDWAILQKTVAPDVFTATLLEWQQTQKAREAIKEEQQKVAKLQWQDGQVAQRQFVAAQQEKLAELIPSWKDPEVAKTEARTLREFGKAQGFTDEELNGVTDARVVALLHKAYTFDKSEKAKPSVQEKIANAIKASAPGNNAPRPKTQKFTEAKSRLAKSGSVEDAAAAIEHLL